MTWFADWMPLWSTYCWKLALTRTISTRKAKLLFKWPWTASWSFALLCNCLAATCAKRYKTAVWPTFADSCRSGAAWTANACGWPPTKRTTPRRSRWATHLNDPNDFLVMTESFGKRFCVPVILNTLRSYFGLKSNKINSLTSFSKVRSLRWASCLPRSRSSRLTSWTRASSA